MTVRVPSDYYRLLREVTTRENWEEWVLYMLAAITDTARWTTKKIAAIRGLIKKTTEHMQTEAPKIYSHELAELIFVRPYCRIGHVIEAGLAQRQTASRYLKTLVDIGLLKEIKAGREKVFLNPAFIDLLKRDDV